MKKYHALLNRYSENETQTLGKLDVFCGNDHIFSCFTLELTWLNNKNYVSCIPKGKYFVKPYSSDKYPEVFQVTNVKGRDKILIHWGNYHFDILGCILVGDSTYDINDDGLLDVTNSKRTLEDLKDIVEYQQFSLVIV